MPFYLFTTPFYLCVLHKYGAACPAAQILRTLHIYRVTHVTTLSVRILLRTHQRLMGAGEAIGRNVVCSLKW